MAHGPRNPHQPATQRGVAAGRSAERGTSGATTGGGGRSAPSYPDSFCWRERPSEKLGSRWSGEPVQTAAYQADRMGTSSIGWDFSGADGGFAQQHRTPDGQHDAEQQPLGTLGAQHPTELPLKPAALGITKQRLNGLFTNDKFCWSRPASLRLKWWRRAYRDR